MDTCDLQVRLQPPQRGPQGPLWARPLLSHPDLLTADEVPATQLAVAHHVPISHAVTSPLCPSPLLSLGEYSPLGWLPPLGHHTWTALASPVKPLWHPGSSATSPPAPLDPVPVRSLGTACFPTWLWASAGREAHSSFYPWGLPECLVHSVQ